MAVRIRLSRMGRKNRPFYRVCVFESSTRRDGKCIEKLGFYDPLIEDFEKQIKLKKERVEYWLSVGAKPTEKVAVLLKKRDFKVNK